MRLLMESCTYLNNHICTTRLYVVNSSFSWKVGAIKPNLACQLSPQDSSLLTMTMWCQMLCGLAINAWLLHCGPTENCIPHQNWLLRCFRLAPRTNAGIVK